MKKITAAMVILLMSLSTFAKPMSEIDFIDSLDSKKVATYGDAVKLFAFQLIGRSNGFNADLSALGSIVTKKTGKDEPLKKGEIANMTARYLKLSDSLMYKMTGFNRYAFRVCAAHGIMNEDGSENDIMSGMELLEVFNQISEYKERR